MTTARGGEQPEIVAAEGDDLVAVGCEQHERPVRDVGGARRGQELAGASTQVPVGGLHVDTHLRRGQSRLARPSSSHQADHATAGDRELARLVRRLETDPHRSLVALQGDHGAGVEHDGHADPASDVDSDFRSDFGALLGVRRPRTTAASSRSARRCRAISSAVISPNSASWSAIAA